MLDAAAEELGRRFRGPFWGSIMIAFAALNWRAVLYLTYPESEWKVRDRILWLQKYVYDDPWGNWWMVGVGPLVIGLFSFAVMPYIVNWFGGFRHRAMVLDENRRKRIDQLHTAVRMENQRLIGEIDALQKAAVQQNQDAKELHAAVQAERDLRQQDAVKYQDHLRAFIRSNPKLKQALIAISQARPINHAAEVMPMLLAADLVNEQQQLTTIGNALRSQL